MLMIMPVFVPIAQRLDVDLIHYGILMTAVMGIALFLPPVGVGLYIVLGLSGATLGEISRHLFPYLSHHDGRCGRHRVRAVDRVPRPVCLWTLHAAASKSVGAGFKPAPTKHMRRHRPSSLEP
jgi:Tripartite ATP-independent periplasmic transporter, DctM component